MRNGDVPTPFWLSSRDVTRELLPEGLDPAGLCVGATCVGDVLVVRWLDRDARRLRDAYGKFWAEFRHHVAGLPSAMPRLWAI